MNIHQSPIVKFFNIDEDEELTFLKQFFLQQYTPANLNFCWLLKLFLRSPIHLSILDRKKHLLSPWQLKHSLYQAICFTPPLVEMLLIVFFFSLCEYVVRGNY